MVSSPAPQTIMCVMQPNPSLLYRQVNYYDGKNVCITESRRRPHVIRTWRTTPSPTRALPLVSRDSQAALRIESTSSQATCVRNASADAEPGLMPHVTPKFQRTKAETVIVQAPVPTKADRAWMIPEVNVKEVQTPPPTPKIKRLPTPDLADLDHRPFCDCCIEGHIFKFCTLCGQKLDSMDC